MMPKLTHAITLMLICLILVILAAPDTRAQDLDSSPDAIEITDELNDEDINEIESSNIWNLIAQAGPIRYPIYGIFIAGIFLISYRTYELYNDQKLESELQQVSFQHLSLNEISSKIANQTDYMLSRIMAKLLNVFQTNRNADYLHDEISNYNTIQQNNFNTFKNRIDFLSDTAGALGLLGTVWGMFFVFSSGTLEREVILVGMGYALMSTLLGLVVSIALNFCSTFTEGYFSRHLENVTTKADELRFRLIELSENPVQTAGKAFTSVVTNNKTKHSNETDAKIGKPENKSAAVQETERVTERINEPEKINLKSKIGPIKAGDDIRNVKIQLLGTLGKPIPAAELDVVVEGKGQINNEQGKAALKTDSDGTAMFDWVTDEKIGEKRVLIRCTDGKYNQVKTLIKADVIPSDPENMKLINNHQAGLTGNKLEKPVSIIVTDKYDNPVGDVNVLMKVTMGDGRFDNGKRETFMKTDPKGKTHIDFTLGPEPGFNAIDISLPEYKISKTFQAVGQEVTV